MEIFEFLQRLCISLLVMSNTNTINTASVLVNLAKNFLLNIKMVLTLKLVSKMKLSYLHRISIVS